MHEPAFARRDQADWRELGACRPEDPELFFPIAAAGPGQAQLDQAKAVCARCQVRAECLEFAVETVQDHGVWGGTSEQERSALRRARARRSRSAAAAQHRQRRPGRQQRPERQESRPPASARTAS